MNRMGRPLRPSVHGGDRWLTTRKKSVLLANLEYWWHTPKLCRKCWRRMKRVRLSMSGYRCVKCGGVRQHSDYADQVFMEATGD